jgi:hypothetical protein
MSARPLLEMGVSVMHGTVAKAWTKSQRAERRGVVLGFATEKVADQNSTIVLYLIPGRGKEMHHRVKCDDIPQTRVS